MAISDQKHDQFSSRLSEHQSQLYGYIRSIVHDPNDAEDLFQQTALLLWKKYDNFGPEQNFVALFCSVARFKVLDFLKQRRRHRAHFSEQLIEAISECQTRRDVDSTQRQEALSLCIGKLSELQQQLLRRYYEGRETMHEIADSLERTVHSTHNSLRHIRRRLFECVTWRLGQREANHEPE